MLFETTGIAESRTAGDTSDMFLCCFICKVVISCTERDIPRLLGHFEILSVIGSAFKQCRFGPEIAVVFVCKTVIVHWRFTVIDQFEKFLSCRNTPAVLLTIGEGFIVCNFSIYMAAIFPQQTVITDRYHISAV